MCSPGESGCNKSPNQVDIWRMERWNWFLAASKSCVCQGGKRVPEKRTRGRRTTRDRFPTGFMPLFFIRRRRALRHQGCYLPACAVSQKARLHFTILFAGLAWPRTSDINTKCIVSKVLINSRPRCNTWNSAMRMCNFTKLCALRNRFSSARIQKKIVYWVVGARKNRSPSLCARPALMRHCIPNVTACTRTKVDAVNLRA